MDGAGRSTSLAAATLLRGLMRALAVAPAAKAWLAATTSARVLSAFDRACNLINQDNALLALVTSERGLNPFAALVDAGEDKPFGAVSAHDNARVTGTVLVLNSIHIEFESARAWNPIPDWPAVRQALAAKPDWLDVLLTYAAAPAGSLLELFDPSRRTTPLLRRAQAGAEALVQGFATNALDTALAGVQQLAGLGGGLTPAGDDFIVGVLLAMHAGLYASRFASDVAEAAASRTTFLSAAYLRAAARGECMFHWHAVFEALCHPAIRHRRTQASAPSAIRQLLAVGHTSGADALAGFCAIRHLSVPRNHL
jgi:hypothetical protein